MNEIVYEGEHLAIGNLGYFFVILSFVGALLGLIAYSIKTWQSTKGRQQPLSKGFFSDWKNIGRLGYVMHAIAVVGIVITLFYIIQNHYYEYFYVWRHSNNILPLKYMISCFWEGQEGSFLLWTFWHAVLMGIFLIRAGKWEAPTMITLMLAQVMLSSFLLGVPLGDGEFFGLNPFRLLRVQMVAPVFAHADYLTNFTDGKGLNPLLQNYWMVIHPPTLFLGFAATIFPFALAIGGLITGRFKEWVKPALPWTVFTVGILGAGILMGGIWAYEALTFGGFWAWDPVENAVLVPWIFVVGGLHTMVIYKNTGRALLTTLIWIGLGFILILYSTYLTRSGVLGDTSVHSFTGDGLMVQLLSFLFSFVIFFVIVIAWQWKKIPKSKSEEDISSREMWMFIGSIVLAIASFQIIFTTSIPVINKLISLFGLDGLFSDSKFAPPDHPISHYNKFQVPFAILIGFLTAIGQYFKYHKTSMKKFYVRTLITFIISALITVMIMIGAGINVALHVVLLLAATYSIVGNIDMLRPYLNISKWRFSGSSLAHIGFGFILLGALISTSKQKVLSKNQMGVDYGEGFNEQEKGDNIYLPLNKPVAMANYLVTYEGDSFLLPDQFFKVKYEKINFETGVKGNESFYLTPNTQQNEQMGLLPNPSTRHYWNRDIYTHVTSIDAENGFAPLQTFTIKKGSEFEYKGYRMEVLDVTGKPKHPNNAKLTELPDSIYIAAMSIKVTKGDIEHNAEPLFVVIGNNIQRPMFELKAEKMRFYFTNINVETGEYSVAVTKKEPPKFIIMKAIEFPFINILWLGCIIMVLGSFVAVYRRIKEA